jgi:hypothetical protein
VVDAAYLSTAATPNEVLGMKFLAVLAVASWLPHCEGDMRWFALGIFLGALVWLLRGVEAQ